MKFLGIARRVDDLGRIVLPIELRRQFGIEAGDALDIAVDPEARAIVLRKAQVECVFCGSREDLRDYRQRRVCQACAAELGGKERPATSGGTSNYSGSSPAGGASPPSSRPPSS